MSKEKQWEEKRNDQKTGIANGLRDRPGERTGDHAKTERVVGAFRGRKGKEKKMIRTRKKKKTNCIRGEKEGKEKLQSGG